MASNTIMIGMSGIHTQDTEETILADFPTSMQVIELYFRSSPRTEHTLTADPRLVEKRTLMEGVRCVLDFANKLVGDAMYRWQEHFSLFVFLYLAGLFTIPLSPTFACDIPTLYDLSVCRDPTLDATFPQWADFPRLMDAQITTFEQLLDT
ncbi:hypothetical protein F5879DRAFT_927736, partial [Lentinula edodes]